MSKPRISILDPRFAYRKAIHTDIRETIARARREQQAAIDAGARKPDASVTALPLAKRDARRASVSERAEPKKGSVR